LAIINRAAELAKGTHMTATSPSLLQRLHNRADAQAWQRLTAVYEPWLRGWLSRQDLQAADVEDVLQDVFLTVSENLAVFVHNGRTGAFRSWLRSILTHRVRHFLRTRRNRKDRVATQAVSDWVEQLADPASALAQQWDHEHDREIVRHLLAQIQHEFNDRTWQVFRMLVLEERPAAEVAAELGITANAVYVAKARVLGRLRSELRGLVGQFE
jgi:RNA polymerase sigma-70 factor (ECF subfamily)